MRLYDALAAYGRCPTIPLHMPGHMRGEFDYLPGAHLDITEIDGFDNLHDADGILRDAMARAAALWGSARAFFSVNGSTGGILSAIHAAARAGDTILMARNCHKSVWHAVELCRLRPVFLTPPLEESFGIFASLPVREVEAALDAHPDAALVVLTSPTYEGILSNVAEICAVAHRRGVPVLVDEAHGAHLGFGGGFPDGAIHAGADLVVQSLHKTLASYTQTALLHVQGSRIDPEAVARSLGIFETSSPSYLLMASADGCVELLHREPERILRWGTMLAEFASQMRGLRRLRHFTPMDRHGIFAHDPGKLLISTRGTALHGPALAEILRHDWGIETEMASGDYLLGMTGLGTQRAQLTRFAEALAVIDGQCKDAPGASLCTIPPPPQPVLLPAEAMERPRRLLSLDRAANCIAADYLWAYPPGVPILSPGMRVTDAALAAISALQVCGIKTRQEIYVVQ